jgi:hypothetical protein
MFIELDLELVGVAVVQDDSTGLRPFLNDRVILLSAKCLSAFDNALEQSHLTY